MPTFELWRESQLMSVRVSAIRRMYRELNELPMVTFLCTPFFVVQISLTHFVRMYSKHPRQDYVL